MSEFTTIAYLLSYPGMIAAIVLLTQALKSLFGLTGREKIQWVVLGLAFIFCAIAAFFQGDFSSEAEIISTVLVWTVNTFIIWFAAMKSFEKIIGEKDDGTFYIDQTDDETDRFLLDVGDNLAPLADKSYLKVKVDTTKKLNT